MFFCVSGRETETTEKVVKKKSLVVEINGLDLMNLDNLKMPFKPFEDDKKRITRKFTVCE